MRTKKSNEDYATWMKNRTKYFAVSVIKYLEKLRSTSALKTIRFQLIKSVTSTAANYRAVCRARSDKEFFSKICIVVEEADETLFWLELIEALEYSKPNEIDPLLNESKEILALVAKAKKTIGQRLKK